ncbi:hypothetical protein BDA99DRAFT_227426 [Phascolomyces articulosus]|uniref:Uncharacterized protein n=1 Tax=Phascolomyces articulosus TaxID=60185 RepID=A0AAD5JZC0_9FUNG|nr:hypothetical protein BDA99DRAFT_227426 [Phascolomyces articulosus]
MASSHTTFNSTTPYNQPEMDDVVNQEEEVISANENGSEQQVSRNPTTLIGTLQNVLILEYARTSERRWRRPVVIPAQQDKDAVSPFESIQSHSDLGCFIKEEDEEDKEEEEGSDANGVRLSVGNSSITEESSTIISDVSGSDFEGSGIYTNSSEEG